MVSACNYNYMIHYVGEKLPNLYFYYDKLTPTGSVLKNGELHNILNIVRSFYIGRYPDVKYF